MLKWPDKDPGRGRRLHDRLDRPARWRHHRQFVLGRACRASPRTRRVNDATTATIWLSGGTAGATYILLSRVITAGARTLEEAIALKVSATVSSIVSLCQVKQALRIDHEDDDATLVLYINAATNAVVAYLKDPDLLSVDSPPDAIDERVIASIIMLVGYWYRAPDNNNDGAFERGYLPMPITAMLYPMRDPTLA